MSNDPCPDLRSLLRFRLNFGGSYSIIDNIDYYVEVKNTINSKLEPTQTRSQTYRVRRELFDVDDLAGMCAHF